MDRYQMKSLTSLFTVLCYFIVTFLEKGAIVICVIVGCGISEPVEASCEKTKCVSCCESATTCKSVKSSVPTPINSIENKSCQLYMEISETIRNQCECNYTKPPLTATYEKHNTDNIRSVEIRSEKVYCFCDLSAGLLVDLSRPRGVHFIIPSTVLLI